MRDSRLSQAQVSNLCGYTLIDIGAMKVSYRSNIRQHGFSDKAVFQLHERQQYQHVYLWLGLQRKTYWFSRQYLQLLVPGSNAKEGLNFGCRHE
jgi:fido (protein-threonine AMPylation protein)